MNLSFPDDLKAKLLDAWRKGKYFTVPEPVSENSCPDYAASEPPNLRFPLKGPTASESLKGFDTVRRWTEAWALHADKEARSGLTLVWKEWDHRQLGKNRIPEAVIFFQLDDLALYLGKRKELDLWRAVCALALVRYPALEPWVRKRPLTLLENAPILEMLLNLTDWYLANRKSGLYLRQVPVPGVDTKFIERNRGLLKQWWNLLDPEALVSVSGDGQPARPALSFEDRFGFRAKPELIRFRILDPLSTFTPYTDLSVPADEFASVTLPQSHILIIENDITALSLPSLPDTAVIFGRGYGFTSLAKSRWLADKNIWYWGDLDTNGFAILDQLRSAFPSARSFLMDRKTLLANRDKWVTEPAPARRSLTRLTVDENLLYRDLLENRLVPLDSYPLNGIPRLEQELIPWQTVLAALEKIILIDLV
ncbi:MAG TPA: DUF2220 family protein [Treponemataceae bacterium]|nr:DUF2220 family protein [Treponemataceae bacterium]